MKLSVHAAGALVIVLCFVSSALFGEEQAASFSDSIKNGFSSNIRSLLFFDAQYPDHSTQNPDNAFLKLYRYSGELDLRPDFFLDTPYAGGLFKPRVTASYRWWEDGIMKGETDGQSRVFVNEWMLLAKPHHTLFLSYGKEKLLWGPSFLASPSNILFKDIEKANPKAEVEGEYLAKLVYLPTKSVTFTAISETEKEVNVRHEDVPPIRALKTDIMGSDFSVSFIGYHRARDRFRLGSFGQWTASDAVVLYYDGILSRGTDALYPERNDTHPLGGEFIKKYDDSERTFATASAGGSYTFPSGETLSMEFLYNGAGYGDAEAKEYYSIRQNASEHFFDAGTLSALSQKSLFESLNTGMPFLRRYYLLAQFQSREIKNALDIALRYIHSMQENAGQAASIVEWRLSNSIQLFNINTVSIDRGRDTEFNSIITRSFMAGIEVHF